MAIKAIVQLHERSTTAALEADLQLRELGLDAQTNSLVASSEIDGAKWHVITKEHTAPSLDGPLSLGSTLVVVGASTLAALSATTGAFSSNVTVGGTLGVTGVSTLAGLSATTGSFSSTLTVTGASTLAALSATTGAFSSNATVGGTFAVSGQSTMGGLEISGGNSGAGRVYSSSSLGFNIQARTGSSYDFSITQPGGAPSYLLRVPTGTATIEIPGAATVGTTFGVTGLQTNSEAIAFGAAGTSGSYRIFRSATNGLQLRGGAGSSYDFAISDASGNLIFRNPTGTSELQLPNAAGVTVTGPATFSTSFTQAAGTHTVSVTDNTSGAVVFQQGSNSYFGFSTVNGSEAITIGNTTTNPTISLLGSGAKTINGVATFGSAPIFSSVTASQFLLVDGSKQLTSVAATGTGSVVLAGAPTLTGTTNAASLTLSSALYVFGTVTFDGEFLLSDASYIGAGGTNWTNETNIDPAGHTIIEITPTADSQTYRVTAGTGRQNLLVLNTSATYNILVDLTDGSGTRTQYIQANRMVMLHYTGSEWYSTY